MFGTDSDKNRFMKSEGGLARVRVVFVSVVGAAKGLWGLRLARVACGGARSSRPDLGWRDEMTSVFARYSRDDHGAL
jgi:hypothetical protein